MLSPGNIASVSLQSTLFFRIAPTFGRGPTFDVKSLKMYVKTSFFDVEHEVKKDSFFVYAGIDIFKKITYIITFSAI